MILMRRKIYDPINKTTTNNVTHWTLSSFTLKEFWSLKSEISRLLHKNCRENVEMSWSIEHIGWKGELSWTTWVPADFPLNLQKRFFRVCDASSSHFYESLEIVWKSRKQLLLSFTICIRLIVWSVEASSSRSRLHFPYINLYKYHECACKKTALETLLCCFQFHLNQQTTLFEKRMNEWEERKLWETSLALAWSKMSLPMLENLLNLHK